MIIIVTFFILVFLPFDRCTTTATIDVVVVDNDIDRDKNYRNLENIMQYFEKDDLDKCQDMDDKTPMSNNLALNLSRLQFKNELDRAQSVYDLLFGQVLNNESLIKDLLQNYLISTPSIAEATLMTFVGDDNGQKTKPNNVNFYIAKRIYTNDKRRNINVTSLSWMSSVRNENIAVNKKFINYFTNFYDDRSRFNFVDVGRRISSASFKPDIVWQQYCDDFIHRQWRIGFIFVRQIVSTGSQ